MLATIRRNFLVILAGNGATAALGFAALAFNSRALGPELLGVLALLQAFFALLVQLFNFDTWQVVVRQGLEARERGESRRLGAVLSLAYLYDAGAAVAAALTGVALVLLILPLLGLGPEHRTYALIFAAGALLSFNSASKGVLRLLDRQDRLTVLGVIAALLTLLASALFYAVAAPFWAYVALYAALPALTTAAATLLAIQAGRQAAFPRPSPADLRDPEIRGEFRRSAWALGALGTLATIRQNADSLVLGALLGPAAVGYYKLAAQLASLVSRLGDPLTLAMYREVTSLALDRGKRPALRRLAQQGAVLTFAGTALATALALLFGDLAVRLLGGAAFAGAAPALAWLVLAQGLGLHQFYARPLVLTLSGPGAFLAASLLGTALFVPVLLAGVPALGPAGAGVAQAAHQAAWLLACLLLIRRALAT